MDRMSTTEQIDALLADAVAEGAAPGIAAIAGNAAQVFYRGAAGTRGEGPMSTDTVVWIASMTKLVTIIGVLQQVEGCPFAR
jgi:CubicO group peptidase (beta-lactamase class C family)